MAKLTWNKVLEPDELPEGRVRSVTCAHRTLCVTHFDGRFSALDDRCPHQGGPLGEGSIEQGWLRCPWHGWDFHPHTGDSPGGHDDGVETFPVEVREDGVYVGLPAEEPHVRTTSDRVAATLAAWGVRWVFGMVGHSNLGLADAVRRQAELGTMRYVGIRHEGAAAFAVSAYGKLTGRPAACLSIAGPGATNLLTGLWDANVDRAPAIALTGQVRTQVLGRGDFQEIDLKAAFGQVAQWSATVLPSSDHAELAALAVKSAVLHDGVSHLVFPDEVQTLPDPSEDRARGAAGRLVPRVVLAEPGQLAAATARLEQAGRPLIIVGHGARFAMGEVVALAERLGCPVATTFKAKGQIPDDHPLAAGVLGRSGTPVASWFMNEADLLVVLGASFSKHTGISEKTPILQVDRDPMVLGKHHYVEAPVLGELGAVLRALRAALVEPASADQRGEVAERWAIWRAEKARREAEEAGRGIHSATLFRVLSEVCPEDAILCVDVGNNTYSFGRYFECRRQAVLMSGYLGSIGFGLPAAMGAWAATREPGPWAGRKVLSISGDGGLGQYLADLTTWVRYGMDCTHVVLHNGELGKISKEQRAGDWDVWETGLTNPSFARFAEDCGAVGIRVTEASELAEALRRAIEHDGPALVEVMTDALLV